MFYKEYKPTRNSTCEVSMVQGGSKPVITREAARVAMRVQDVLLG